MNIDLLQTWATFSPEMALTSSVQDMLSPRVTVVEGQKLKPSVRFRWINSNLLNNPGFESGMTGWSGAATAVDVSDSPSGAGKVAQVVSAGGIVDVVGSGTPIAIPTVTGETFYGETQARKTTTGTVGTLQFATAIYNSGATVYPIHQQLTLNNFVQGVWKKLSGIITVPTLTGATIRFRNSVRSDIPAGQTIQFDDSYASYSIAGKQPVQLRVLAYGAAGNLISDTLIQAYTDATGKPEQPWTVIGNTEYTVPPGATNVKLLIRATADAKFGTLQFGRPKLVMETLTAPSANAGYGDRWRFAVQDVHGQFLTRDLIPVAPAKVIRNLSGPSSIEFKVHYSEPSVQMPDGSGAIQFKPFGQLVHALKEDQFGNEVVWASCIVQPSDIDPASGILDLRTQGFSGYAKGLPWLENWNPIAVDPFEVVVRIWNHIQSYVNGDLGVSVYPTSSGTQMLPGFSFNNEEFVQDFFAIFIREADEQDCGDFINKLARDIPFDYFEESAWNLDRSDIVKKIRLGYPSGGFNRAGLVFRPNENIRETKQKQEVEKDWFSDISLKGYFPGKQYSVKLGNADPNRLRRVMDELDLKINSQERAAAWAKRLLTRRQTPNYYESIIIDPYHSNAPFGTFDVGDNVLVEGPMPWKGDMKQIHKVLAHVWDEEKNVVQLALMAEGAFNYDPIEYIPL